MKHLIFIVFFSLICCIVRGQKESDFQTYKTADKNIIDFCFTSSGASVLIADNNEIKIFDSSSGKLVLSEKTMHGAPISALKISRDSSVICSGGKDNLLIIKNLITKETEVLNEGHGFITALSISSNSSFLAAGFSDGAVMVYNLIEYKPVYYLTEKFSIITDVEFSPDCSILAIAGGGPVVLIVDRESGKIISRLPGHKSWSRDVSFNNTGDRFITCGDDGVVSTYSIGQQSALKKITSRKVSSQWIMGATFLPDTKSFAYVTDDGCMMIETPFSVYRKRMHGLAYKIEAMPRNDGQIRIAVSFKNRGVIALNTLKFKTLN